MLVSALTPQSSSGNRSRKAANGSDGYSLMATRSGATAFAQASRSFCESPRAATPSCSGEKAALPHAARIFCNASAS
eukprot:11428930-Alexandrium_andersonii.AAC.1